MTRTCQVCVYELIYTEHLYDNCGKCQDYVDVHIFQSGGNNAKRPDDNVLCFCLSANQKKIRINTD